MFKINNKDTKTTSCWLWSAVCSCFLWIAVYLFEPCLLCSVRSCFFGLQKQIILRAQKFRCEKVKNLIPEDELNGEMGIPNNRDNSAIE